MVALSFAPFDKGGHKIHKIARLWAKIDMGVGGITASITGLARVGQPPYIFMCNHQSALDIHVLLAALPFDFKFIAKRSLFLIPFFGWTLTRAGHISLDRDNPRRALKAMDEASRRIQAGANILVFPEGTRNVDGKLLPFKKGVFSLALKAGVPIVPIGICGTSALQPEGYQVPLQTGNVVINVGEPITIAGKGTSYKDELAQTVRARIEQLRQPHPGSCGGASS